MPHAHLCKSWPEVSHILTNKSKALDICIEQQCLLLPIIVDIMCRSTTSLLYSADLWIEKKLVFFFEKYGYIYKHWSQFGVCIGIDRTVVLSASFNLDLQYICERYYYANIRIFALYFLKDIQLNSEKGKSYKDISRLM